MLIQRILETRLDITDPADIFNRNRQEVYLKHLTSKFKGKCFRSCLIINIVRITKHSLIYMSEDLSGSAFVNVDFEVECIVYSRGEVITGCHIAKIEADGRILAKSEYSGLQIRQDASRMNIYKEGQVVPFIIDRVRYNPAQYAISVEAIPFIPVYPKLIIYKINKPLGKNDMERIIYMFGRLEEVKNKINKLDKVVKNAFNFFQNLMYPFKKYTEFKSPGFIKTKLTWENVKDVTGYIVQPRESKFHDEEFFVSENFDETEYEDATLVFALDIFLRNTILHHEILLEFVKTYPTFEKIQEYKDIWRMFNMLKR